MNLQRSNWSGTLALIFSVMFMSHCSKSPDRGSSGGGDGGTTTTPTSDCSQSALQDENTIDPEQDQSADCETASGNTPTQTTTNAPVEDIDDGDDDDSATTIPQDVLSGLQDGQGCLQGIVTNGFTGQPVDLTDKLTDPSGLYVLIRNQKLKAEIIPDDPNLIGQYYICGIPVEETYPVFAFLTDYYSFESTVNISSTRAGSKVDADIKAEVKKADPISRTNIVVFPNASGGRDLLVRVYHEGIGVEGAIVDVEPLSGSDHFAFEGTFASSADTRLFPQRAETDPDGNVVFPGDQMALGHRYRVTVTIPDALDLKSPASKEITFGISGTVENLDANNYTLNFLVEDATESLSIISCSPEGETYNPTGTIAVVFNRDIAIVSPNTWEAELLGAGAASLADHDLTSAGSETVSASINGGNTLYLRPKWTDGTEPKTPDYSILVSDTQNEDVNTVINYKAENMSLTVVGDNAENMLTLSALPGAEKCGDFSVRFFREFE